MVTVANLNYGTFPIRVEYYGGGAGYPHPPLKSAAASAEAFRRAVRLSVTELLADDAFRALARKAAEKGKAFTAELLEWEKKDVVAAAVAVIRAEVDAERAEAARIAAEAKAVADAIAEQERPTREAVLAAYQMACDYRTCTQGHTTRIVIGNRVGTNSDTFKGARYSSRCTYSRVSSVHTFYVRPDWLTRVNAVAPQVDGMLVLDAEAVGFLPGDVVVYELRIVRQGAGTGLKVETIRATKGEDAGTAVWVPVEKRTEKKVTAMPASVLADYLEDRGAATEDVMPLRVGFVS